VIIDAFSSPTIASDLKDFDRDMGLPDPSFTIIPVGNVPPFDINDEAQFGWAGEISLDVQWAHAMAPGAAINLVEAQSNQDADIFAATKYAIDHKLGDVISQSFGEAEACVDPALLHQENALFAKAAKEGMTLFASTGDSGAALPSCDGSGALLAAPTPASDPNVTGVGGTTLNADPVTGSYIGETAWTEPLFGCKFPAIDFNDIYCSGGGFSTVYARPGWQKRLVRGGGGGRGVPDVAYDAGVNGGVLVHIGWLLAAFGFDPDAPLYLTFGGTSAGAPQWAGLAADADQMAKRDLGNINDNLYKLAAHSHGATPFHDVTTGTNRVAEIDGQGYDAGPGWDAVTGLGTPNAAALIPALAKH
jgi:subtilase family serine protease